MSSKKKILKTYDFLGVNKITGLPWPTDQGDAVSLGFLEESLFGRPKILQSRVDYLLTYDVTESELNDPANFTIRYYPPFMDFEYHFTVGDVLRSRDEFIVAIYGGQIIPGAVEPGIYRFTKVQNGIQVQRIDQEIKTLIFLVDLIVAEAPTGQSVIKHLHPFYGTVYIFHKDQQYAKMFPAYGDYEIFFLNTR